MRLIVGYTFMLAGWGKLTHLEQVTENFAGWGIPFPNISPPFVSGVECFGGVLILGLFTLIPAAMLAWSWSSPSGRRNGATSTRWRRCSASRSGLFRGLHVAAIAGPGAASLDRLLVNAAGHSEKST